MENTTKTRGGDGEERTVARVQHRSADGTSEPRLKCRIVRDAPEPSGYGLTASASGAVTDIPCHARARRLAASVQGVVKEGARKSQKGNSSRGWRTQARSGWKNPRAPRQAGVRSGRRSAPERPHVQKSVMKRYWHRPVGAGPTRPTCKRAPVHQHSPRTPSSADAPSRRRSGIGCIRCMTKPGYEL